MKKIILILVLLIFISGCSEKLENPIEEISKEIFCPDYDANKEECSLHQECEWDAKENNCDPIGGMSEKDDNDDDTSGVSIIEY